MSKKAGSQHAGPFYNISEDSGGYVQPGLRHSNGIEPSRALFTAAVPLFSGAGKFEPHTFEETKC
jgi:hypothetical protein